MYRCTNTLTHGHGGMELECPDSRDSKGGPSTVAAVRRFASHTLRGVAPRPSITEYCMYTVSLSQLVLIHMHVHTYNEHKYIIYVMYMHMQCSYSPALIRVNEYNYKKVILSPYNSFVIVRPVNRSFYAVRCSRGHLMRMLTASPPQIKGDFAA